MAVARYAHDSNTRPADAKSGRKGGWLGWLLRRLFLMYVVFITLTTCPSNPGHLVCRTEAAVREVINGPVHGLFVSTETGARISNAYNAHLVPLYERHAEPLLDNTRVFVAETVAPALSKASKPACDALHRAVDPYTDKAYAAYSAHAKPTVDMVAGWVKQTVSQAVVPVVTATKEVVVRVGGDYVLPLAKSGWSDYIVPLHVNHVQPLWAKQVYPAICKYSKIALQSVRENLLPGIVSGTARASSASWAFAQEHIVPYAKRGAVHAYLFFTRHVSPPVRSLYDQHMRQYVDRVVPWDQVEVVYDKSVLIGSTLFDIACSFTEEFYYMCYTIFTGDEHPTVIQRHHEEQLAKADQSTTQTVFSTPAEHAQNIARKISGSARQWFQVARGWVAPANQQYVYDKATDFYHRATKAVVERIPKQQPVALTSSVSVVELTLSVTMSASPASTLEPISSEQPSTEEEPVVVKTIVKESVAEDIVAEETAVEETAAEETAAEETVADEATLEEIVVEVTAVEEPRIVEVVAEDTVIVVEADAEMSDVVDAAIEETLATTESAVAEEPVIVEELVATIATAPEQPLVATEIPVKETILEEATLTEVVPEQKPVVETAPAVEKSPSTDSVGASSSDKPEIDANQAASAVYDAREAMAGVGVDEQQKKEFEDLVGAAKDRDAANLEKMPQIVNDIEPKEDDKTVGAATTAPAAAEDDQQVRVATTLPAPETASAAGVEATSAAEPVEEHSTSAKAAEVKRELNESGESISQSASLVAQGSTTTVTAQTTATRTVNKVVTVEQPVQPPKESAETTTQAVVTQYLTKTVRKQSTVTSQVTTTVKTTRSVTVNSTLLETLTTDKQQVVATTAASEKTEPEAAKAKHETSQAAGEQQQDGLKEATAMSAVDTEPAAELPAAKAPLVEEPVVLDSQSVDSSPKAEDAAKEEEVVEETSPLLSIVVPVDDEVRKAASNWVKDARKSISKEVAQERTRQSTSATEEEQVEQETVAAAVESQAEPSPAASEPSHVKAAASTAAVERAVAESAVQPKKEEAVVAPGSAAKPAASRRMKKADEKQAQATRGPRKIKVKKRRSAARDEL